MVALLERGGKKAAREERRRCLELVEAYRDHLETTLARVRSTPKYQTPQYRVANLTIEKVISSLRRVEDKIKGFEAPTGTDFSLEEMALAERIIDEQNKNPFEVEP